MKRRRKWRRKIRTYHIKFMANLSDAYSQPQPNPFEEWHEYVRLEHAKMKTAYFTFGQNHTHSANGQTDPNAEKLTPLDSSKTATANSANGAGATFGWNPQTKSWQ